MRLDWSDRQLWRSAWPAAIRRWRRPTEPGRRFWKAVQGTCNATGGRSPPSELGPAHRARRRSTSLVGFRRANQNRFQRPGFSHFGLTEAEHEEDDGGVERVGHRPSGLVQGDEILAVAVLVTAPSPTSLEVRRAIATPSTLTQEIRRRRALIAHQLPPGFCVKPRQYLIRRLREIPARGGVCAGPSSIPHGRQPFYQLCDTAVGRCGETRFQFANRPPRLYLRRRSQRAWPN